MCHSPYLQHLIQKRIDAWVSRGRATKATVSEDGTWSLRFGHRDRIRMIAATVILGGFCGLALWFDQAVQPLGFGLRLGYLAFLFPVSLVSAFVTIHMWTTNVILSNWGIVLRRFGTVRRSASWPQVRRVRYCAGPSSIVMETENGRIRISSEIGGLWTLAACLNRLDQTVVDPGVIPRLVENAEAVRLAAPAELEPPNPRPHS